MSNIEKTQIFPKNYEHSRSRFRDYLKGFKSYTTQEQSFQVPSQTDQNLSVDIQYIASPKPSGKLFVLSSGVHGPEGYAGSGLQEIFIKNYAKNFLECGHSLFLIHAINPWGFKNHSRLTENGINLNRNFSFDPKTFQGTNSGYEKLRYLFETAKPLAWPKLRFAQVSSVLGYKMFKREFNFQELNQAVGQGQYTYQKGLEYGGRKSEPQVIFLASILKPMYSKFDSVLCYDVHTGLGKDKHFHFIPGSNASTHTINNFEQIVAGLDSQKFSLSKPHQEGFYAPTGDFADFQESFATKSTQVTAGAVEIGTIGQNLWHKLRTLKVILDENQGRNWGFASAHLETKVKKSYLEHFFPDRSQWREAVISNASSLFERTLLSMNQNEPAKTIQPESRAVAEI